jgi:group I intron endonuclease
VIGCGIYEIRNLANGKRYVGSSVNFRRRWYAHRWQLLRGMHANEHLQAAWNKHGEDQFDFRLLLICNRENLVMYEQIAIEAVSPEYNKCEVAGTTLGFKFSPESLARMSKSHSAANLSPETRAKMSASQSKRTHPPEVRAKLSALGMGRKFSAEECERRSLRMMGNVVSEETKRRISEALTGRKRSPEQRAQIARNSTGRRHTPEAKAKMSAAKKGNTARLGHVFSAETRAKQSAGIRAAIARRKARG